MEELGCYWREGRERKGAGEERTPLTAAALSLWRGLQLYNHVTAKMDLEFASQEA